MGSPFVRIAQSYLVLILFILGFGAGTGPSSLHRIGRCSRGFAHLPRCPDKDVVGPPMFPGNPSVLLSCSATPAGLRRLAFAALECCPRLLYNEDSSDASVSWLDHTTSALAVYASCRHCCTATQDSLPGVANLAGWDYNSPTEFLKRVSTLRASPSL